MGWFNAGLAVVVALIARGTGGDRPGSAGQPSNKPRPPAGPPPGAAAAPPGSPRPGRGK
jgi:hypothetical protein